MTDKRTDEIREQFHNGVKVAGGRLKAIRYDDEEIAVLRPSDIAYLLERIEKLEAENRSLRKTTRPKRHSGNWYR